MISLFVLTIQLKKVIKIDLCESSDRWPPFVFFTEASVFYGIFEARFVQV